MTGGSAALVVNGNSTVNGNVDLNGTIYVSSGQTLTLNPGSVMTWSGGTLSNPGTLVVASGASLNLTGSDSKTLYKCSINNSGTITDSSTSSLFFNSLPALNNLPGGVVNITAGDSLTNSSNGGGTVNNYAGALFQDSGTAASTDSVPFNNLGGTIEVDAGTLTLSGGGTSTGGAFNVVANATLAFGGSATFTMTGTYTGSGSGVVSVSNSNASLTMGTEGATFNFPAGMFQLSGGTISIPSGRTMTLASGSAMTWSAGKLSNVGALNISSGAAMNLTGSSTKTQYQAQINNSGTIVDSGTNSSWLFNSGPVVNNLSGGVVNITAGDGMSNGSGGGTFNNYAGAVFQDSGTAASTNTVPFNNLGGTIEVDAGTLTLSGGGTATGGAFNVAANATLAFGGSATFTMTGTYTGSGSGVVSVANSNASLTIGTDGATFDFPSGMLQLSGGTISIPSGRTLTFPSGSALSWSAGKLSGTGSLNLAAGATLSLSGSSTKTLYQTQINNSGTIVDSGSNSSWSFNSGPVVNNLSGGVVNITAGDGLSNGSGGGTFNNYAGALFHDSGTANSANTVPFNNQGTVSVGAGTLSFSSVTQVASGKLTGGTWIVSGSGKLTLPGSNLTENDASITLGGSGSFPQLAGLTKNVGSLSLLGGVSLATTGNLVNTGNLTMGPAGVWNITGTVTLSPSGNVTVQLASADPATGIGQVKATGAATLGGTLGVCLVDGFQPTVEALFPFLTAASLSGTFSSVSNVTPGSPLLFSAAASSPTVESIEFTPYADMVATQIVSPAVMAAGLAATVSWTTANQGTSATSTSWHDAVFLSADGSIDAGDIQLAWQPEGSLPLAPGDSYSDSATFTVPVDVPPGNYSVLVSVNHDLALTETTSSNNVLSKVVQVLGPTPDLQVTDLAVTPASPQSGQQVTVSWNDANTGTGTATGAWCDRVLVVNTATSQTLVNMNRSYSGNSLAPGGTTARSYSFSLPEGAAGAGQLQVSVTADFVSQISEYNSAGTAETNNTGSLAIVSTIASYPDLQVTGLAAAPVAPQSGQQITISWNEANTGDGSADGSWNDHIQVINTTTGQSLVNSVKTYGGNAVDAGGTVGRSYSFSLPNGTAGVGQWQITVTVDNSSQIFEYNSAGTAETNNSASLSMVSTLAPYPDLQIAGIAVTPGSPQSGQEITISWNELNTGDGTASGSWSDHVQVVDTTTGQTLLDTNKAFTDSTIVPGDSAARSYSLTLPDGADGAGELHITVSADPGHQVYEYNPSGTAETNNGADLSVVSTVAPYPDLQVTGLAVVSFKRLSGEPLTIRWNDVNTGDGTASGSWSDLVQVVNTTTGKTLPGKNPLFTGSVIAPGESLAREVVIPLPNDATSVGTLQITVTVDYGNCIYQYNAGGTAQANDSASVTVPIAMSPYPDLTVSSIEPGWMPLSGTSVPVTYVVTNAGTAPTPIVAWQDWVVLSQDPTLADTYNDGLLNGVWNNDRILTNQPVIQGFTNRSYLSAGESYSNTVDLPVPIDARGTWYTYVIAGGTGLHHPHAMSEATYLNNLLLGPSFNVRPSPAPALVVTAVHAPSQNFSGQPMKVSWTVSNQGAGPTAADSWTDAVYMSPTPALDASAQLLGKFTHGGVLGLGDSYSQDQSVNLPVGVSGTYYILVRTDVNGHVFQDGNTGGNLGHTGGTVTVNLTPPPNLAAGISSAPATALASHSLSFGYHVANVGAGGTPNKSWTDSFYLSPTAAYDSSTAVKLGSQTHSGDLIAGASYDVTANAVVPNGVSGTYYLIVDTDSADAVFELDNTNNRAASAAIQVESRPADLVVASANVPPSAQAGSAVRVEWTVVNQGAGDTVATTWQDIVYAGTGATLGNSPVKLGVFVHTGLLAAGASYGQSQLVSLPIGFSGPYNLFVVTNSNHAVYEGTNAANDTSAPAPVAVWQFLADLRISAVDAPMAVATGDKAAVQWNVRNEGAGATSSNHWNECVWISTNPVLGAGTGDVLLTTVQHTNTVDAGTGYSGTATVTIPRTLTAGSYYFFVVVDTRDDVLESGENNNTASAAVSVAVSPVADLAVSNVSAPASATSGQSISVSWTVTNAGAYTGAATITDWVYLSYTASFEPGKSRYLGMASHAAGLAAGDSYTQTAKIRLPAGLAGNFYVFVQTNSNSRIFERVTDNNAADAPQTIQIQLPAPADLVAGTITIPANAVAGQDMTINYQVTNGGVNSASGEWTDSLYLSPTTSWSVGAPLLGQVDQKRDLSPGASYTGALTAPLPGLSPGSYYVIVRTNVFYTIPEATQDNNFIASLGQTAIDAPALTLGTAVTGTLNAGQSVFYKIVVDAGQTLKIKFDSQGASSWDELYASYGDMPTRGRYDYRYQTPAPSEQIVVPTTQSGTYYVMAYGSSVSTPYTVTAALVPFAITAVSPGQVGAGPVTIEVDGSRFDNRTTFQLVAEGHVVESQQVYLQDSSTAFVKFDLTGTSLKRYDLQATQANGSVTKLTQAVYLVAGVPGHVNFHLSTPHTILPGRRGWVTVDYVNEGNTDALAPLVQLLVKNFAVLPFVAAFYPPPPKSWFTAASVQMLAISDTGPAGVLRPGESGSIDIPFVVTGASGDDINFQLAVSDDSQSIDWASQEDSLRLPSISEAAWPAVFANFVAGVGSTGASLHAVLAADATYFGRLEQRTGDVNQLLSFEVQKANAAYTAPTLVAITADDLHAPGMDLTFTQSFLSSIAGRYSQGMLGYGWTTNWDISASADTSGNATITIGGSPYYYTLQSDGTFKPESGNHAVLTQANDAFRLVLPHGDSCQFNPSGTLAYLEDTHGNRITCGYNTQNQLVSLTHSNGEFLTLAYNVQGRLASLTDSTGLTENYDYDASGQFLTTYADRHGTTTFSYLTGQSAQRNNALAEIAFADNTHLFYSYDSQGRLVNKHGDGGANGLSYTYLAPGGYVLTDGDGTTVLFDLYGRPAETIDALGNETHLQYDGNLNLTRVTGPLGSVYDYSYDASGNLTSVITPSGNKIAFTYDARNNLTGFTDAKGHKTAYAYDAANNLLSITYPDSTKQSYLYDPLGQATQYLNARGHAVGFQYDANGRVTKETFADGSSCDFTYDARGNLLTAVDAAGTTAFSYADPRNPDLLTSVAYPDGTYLQFTYNAVGQRTQSVDQAGFQVNYAYDSAGRLSELTDADGGRIVAYTYDPAGLLATKDMGNGTRTTYTYDADHRVLTITNLAPDYLTVNSYNHYTYDALGNLLADASQDGDWTYTYDADGQLTRAVFASADLAVLPNQDIQYVYDAAGNRVSQTVNGVTTDYVVNSLNEYLSATIVNGGTTTYHYDADGNLVSQTDPDGTTTYSYNDLDRLLSVGGIGVPASYTYDPLGNRLAQTVAGVTTRFQVDPAGIGNVVATASEGGGVTAHYTYGLGLVSQVNAAGAAAYYDFNNIGSTVGMTGASGDYVNRYAYLPFGQTTNVQASVPNRFTFVGQWGVMANDGGTVAVRARVYATPSGRFIQRDPLGLGGADPNLFRYVANAPTELVDPMGLKVDAEIPGTVSTAIDVIGTWAEIIGRNSRGLKGIGIGTTAWAAFAENPHDPARAIAATAGAYFGGELGADLGMSVGGSLGFAAGGFPGAFIGAFGLASVFGYYGGELGEAIAEYIYDHTSTWVTNMIHVYAPHDPNNLIGPAGFGSQNFVSAGQALPYTVNYENEATAGVPAQEVTITEQLDPNLNWESFRLGSFGFGGQVYEVPANSAFYQTEIDFTEEYGYLLDVSATIDVRTGTATWTFTTIDPATGQIPLDPTIGFLPPDDDSGSGEGFVSYTVLADSAAPTGTVIEAQATITFYTQPPMDTPLVFNTLDTGAGLAGSVGVLPAFVGSTQFDVSWSGSGDPAGSAIQGYTVYVSDNDGPYDVWLADTTLASAAFVGQSGHKYAFYSVAKDNVGNVQPMPTTAQAATTVDVTPPASTVAELPPEGDTASFLVSWSGEDSPGGSGIAAYSVFVADNGGSFSPWQTATTATAATFTGQEGHTYGFYSVAVDNAGNVQPTPAGAQATTTIPIANVPPTADVSTPNDGFPGVRGQLRSFALTASDTSPADQAAGFTFAVNWGDGSTAESFSGLSGTEANHVFAAAGTYSVSVTATDKEGAQSTAATRAVTIRAVEQQGTSVAVGGTNASDAITVTQGTGSGAVVMSIGGVSLGTYTLAGGGALKVYGQAGDDTFRLISVSATIDGGTGSDTLIPSDAAHTWNLTGNCVGNVDSLCAFAGIENLIGGSGADRFVASDTAAGFTTINGWSGADTLDFTPSTGPITANLLTGKVSRSTGPVDLASFVSIESFVGSASSSDTLQGTNAVTNWYLSGPNTGTANGIAFASFENLIGGSAGDYFNVTAATTGVSGQADGGGGTDSVQAFSQVNTWNLSGMLAGNLNGTLPFANIEKLLGTSQADTFLLAEVASGFEIAAGAGAATDTISYAACAGPVSVNLQTGAATKLTRWYDVEKFIGSAGTTDTISRGDLATNWQITGPDAGIAFTTIFTSFENLLGGSGGDYLTLTSATASLSGLLDGGGGSDSLQSLSQANTWNLTGPQAGNLNGTLPFTGIERLLGGSGSDEFRFTDAAGSYEIAAGAGSGIDVLNYAACTTAVNVNLQAATASKVTRWWDIESLVGSPSSSPDTLTGADSITNWTLSGTAAGTVGTRSFTSFENLTGGSTVDRFQVAPGAAGFNSISGVGGSDSIDFSTLSSGSAVVNLQTQKVFINPGLVEVGNFISIESFVGSPSTADLLVGANATTNWYLTGLNAGTVNGAVFSGFENLLGGTAGDYFILQASSAAVGGIVDGGAGTDSLKAFDLFNIWTLTAAQAGNLNGTLAFTGIEMLTGGTAGDEFRQSAASATGFQIAGGSGSGVDKLVGADAAHTWNLTGIRAGNLDGSITFGDMEYLTGGSDADRFVVGANAAYFTMLNGGGGSDTIDYSTLTSNWALVNQQTSTASKYPGPVVVGTFASIESFLGATAGTKDVLIGPDAATNWEIISADTGTVGTRSFSSFENLTGGSGNDQFLLRGSASVAGALSGGAGSDALDYTYYGTPGVSVDLSTGTATGIGSGASSKVSQIEIVVGTTGADTLVGDAQNNILLGGQGNDTLRGNAGRDLLIGGTGADQVYGGAGQDILVGGWLAYHSPETGSPNYVALRAILAEWARVDLDNSLDPSVGYQARINHLRTANSGGLNGGYVLNSTTVRLDSAVDHLYGEDDLDWFLKSLEDDSDRVAEELFSDF